MYYVCLWSTDGVKQIVIILTCILGNFALSEYVTGTFYQSTMHHWITHSGPHNRHFSPTCNTSVHVVHNRSYYKHVHIHQSRQWSAQLYIARQGTSTSFLTQKHNTKAAIVIIAFYLPYFTKEATFTYTFSSCDWWLLTCQTLILW